MLEIVKAIRTGAGELEGQAKRRLEEVEHLLNRGPSPSKAKIDEFEEAEARP